MQLEVSLTPEQLAKYEGMNKLDFIIGNKNTTESAGHFYVDDAELTVGNQIAHTHDLVKTEEKAATCTEDGNKAYWICNSCKKLFADENSTTETTLEQVTLKATGHSFGEWKQTKEPTCTEAGEETRS